MTGPMRTIYDRMTNPTPDDLAVGDRIRVMSRPEVIRVIDQVLIPAFKHLADQRDDMVVDAQRDQNSWVIRVALTPLVLPAGN